MKNFSELTAIKSDLTMELILVLKSIDFCYCTVIINDRVEFQDNLVGNHTFIKTLPLKDTINIKINVNRKHPQAIEIVNLTIDDYEVMPVFLNRSTPPTNYLDFTGTWSLQIPNFYPWYHEITGQGWIA